MYYTGLFFGEKKGTRYSYIMNRCTSIFDLKLYRLKNPGCVSTICQSGPGPQAMRDTKKSMPSDSTLVIAGTRRGPSGLKEQA